MMMDLKRVCQCREGLKRVTVTSFRLEDETSILSFQFEQLAVAAVGDGHRLSRSHLMKTIHVLEKSFGNRAKFN